MANESAFENANEPVFNQVLTISFEKQTGPGGSNPIVFKDHVSVTRYQRIAAQTFAEPSVPGRQISAHLSDGN